MTKLTDEEIIKLAKKLLAGEIAGWDFNTILIANESIKETGVDERNYLANRHWSR